MIRSKRVTSCVQASTFLSQWPYLIPMKQLLRTNDPTEIAFAKALLQGEGIAAFEWDVNMSNLDGSIGILPRRIMVADADFDAARKVMTDNGLSVAE